jgi:hypothetical protein
MTSEENATTNPRDENRDSERFASSRKLWNSAPVTVRRTIVAVTGTTLLLLGAALVVLPGPFTLPLVVAGLAVLGTEFAWAEHLLTKGREKAGKAVKVVRKRRQG